MPSSMSLLCCADVTATNAKISANALAQLIYRLMRRLPPLSQLRAFEAAARHRSFKHAAQELSVTATAISHQIRLLEDRLGQPLFERRTRQVALTAAARSLYPVLREGFDAFAEALATLAPGRTSAVTLAVTPAFASQWLLPRLPQFQDTHPHIELRILAGDAVVDLAQRGADLAVRYGGGPYPDHETHELAADRFLPIASPLLALREPAELLQHRLIHFDWHRDADGRPTWARWLKQAGLRHDDAQRGLRFSEESHAIQAAIAGHGVALLSHTLVLSELGRGILVAPFGPHLAAPTWQLLRYRTPQRPVAQQAVWEWLTAGFPPKGEGSFMSTDN